METLKLKVYMIDGERKIENFSPKQWDEVCIIFEKLVRNLKEEKPEIKISDFNKINKPYITMKVGYEEIFNPDKMDEDEDEGYIARYLSGEETENPVYFDEDEEPHYVGSTIILEEKEEKDTTSLLERFNKLAVDVGMAD